MLNLTEVHLQAVSRAIYGESRPCRIDLVRGRTDIADSSMIYLVDAAYIMHVSPRAFPLSVQEEVAAMQAMRAVLGDHAHVMPGIVADGMLDGCSFKVVPLLRPLSSRPLLARIDRLRIRRPMLGWLRAVTGLAEPPSDDAAARFSRCLASLAAMADLPGGLQSAVRDARADLDGGRTAPAHVPMHGDLWTGNILRRREGGLCIIDWGASLPRGYGIFDFMRLCDALRLSRASARRELSAHVAMLGGRAAARLHLLAALGHFAGHLGQFPRKRFLKMAADVHCRFEALY